MKGKMMEPFAFGCFAPWHKQQEDASMLRNYLHMLESHNHEDVKVN
jgi:hypothetical protein